ncbi:M14 family zinc carboxypeptidase [Algibacter sp. PT7-4]|uniref:M14 family zinc carboxypeptidase n=1 Tax=Algibacter ulvanivorans TaxID=3400999 RepID=UPI003AABDB49
MKKITLLSILLVLSLQFVYSQNIIAKRIKINNPTRNQLLKVKEIGVDLSCGAIYTGNSLILELGERELNALQEKNIPYTVIIEDLIADAKRRSKTELPLAKAQLESMKTQGLASKSLSTKSTDINNYIQYEGCTEVDWNVPTNFNLGSMLGCLTYSEMLAELDQMRLLYPHLISVKTDASPGTVTHGNSYTNGGAYDTWAGQPIYYVRISDNPDIDETNEPESLYSGMTHSREVSSMMNLIFYMWYILENYDSDPGIKNLVDNHEMYFIPVANPDGLMWNEETAPSGNGMQRKNLGPYNTGNNHQRGVDLNRNYDYFWGSHSIYAHGTTGSSGSTGSDTYRGPSAFSEPETQIVRNFSATREFKTAMNHHATSNLIPHAYNGYPDSPGSGREAEYHKFCHDMTRFNRYIYGEAPDILTIANGDMSDWMLGGATDLNGSNGSGQGILALAPENGSWISSDGEGGFWPNATKIVEIAKRAVRMNFVNAYHSGKFAHFHDLNPSNITATSGNLEFGLEYLGQTLGDITLNITPVSSNITSITPPATQSGWSKLEQRTVTAAYTLDAGIQANDEIEFQITLSNDDGYVMYRANIIKSYNPSVLFIDNPDTDNLTNWTASGGSWGTTSDSYSGTTAITDSPSGAYGNNQSKTLTLNSSVDLSSSNSAVVQFFAKWDIERNFDYVQIEGSTNGSTWLPLCGKYSKPGSSRSTNRYSSSNSSNTSTGKGTSDQNNQPTGESIYDADTMDKWVMEEILIDGTENSFLFGAANARFRFVFDSDNSNRADGYPTTFDGFIFDDFKIIDIKIPCELSVPTNVTASNITFNSATINWDNIPSATYDLRYKETSSGTWINDTDLTSANRDLSSLSPSTIYEVQVRTKCGSNNSSYSSSVQFTTPAISYCDSNGSSQYDTGVTRVSFNTINNAHTSNRDNNGYQDFTTISTTVTQGSSHTLTVNINRDTGNSGATAWIDLNIDGDFNDPGEEFNLGNATTGVDTQTSITPSITFPSGAGYPLGETRLRVAARYNNFPAGPCATNYDGEVEDYKIIITSNLTTWYQDLDNDTFGNPNISQEAATQPAGYVANNTDCDDTDNTVNTPQQYYVDADGDGFGSTTTAMLCESSAPAGYSDNNTDCDDTDNTVNTPQQYYVDADGDGFGSTTTAMLCESSAPAGYSDNNTDCDDSDNTVNTPQQYYVDADGDGFGSTTTAMLCESSAPAGYSTNNTDCDDTDNTVNTPQQYYVDADGDGFGSTTTAMLCESSAPAGYSDNNTDCDDTDNTVNTPQQYYVDADGDGFGSTTTAMLCESSAPAGYSDNNTDCDDSDNTVNTPQQYYVDADGDGFGSTTTAMLCESSAPAGYSNNNTDCDDTDNTVNTPQQYYVDADGDGFGSTTTAMLCESSAPAGYSDNNTDCDDTDNTVNTPQQYYVDADGDGFGSTTTAMLCESSAPAGYSDNNTDCDDTDNTVNTPQQYYVDADGDGFGSTTTAMLCESSAPAGYSTNNTDCDDTDNTVNTPQQYYVDADGDGFGSTTTAMLCESSAPAGYSDNNTDCDDTDNTVNTPQQYYVDADGDGFGSTTTAMLCESSAPAGYSDNNTDCDDTDNTVNTPQQYYVDADGDGFGSTTTAMLCESSAPAGYSTNNTDCDDTDNTVNTPQQYYVDADGDGFGSTTTAMLCESSAPAGYSDNNTDCDDTDNTVNTPQQYYVDADGDGFGSTTIAMLCESSAPAGYSTNNTDCDDTDNTVNTPQQYYVDADGDGFGSTTTAMLCESSAPAGYSDNNTDCDDTDNTVNTPQQYYVDADGDGFGSTTIAMLCESSAPAGYSTNNTDCDDTDNTVNTPQQYYVDADGDGFGSTTIAMLCESSAPAGYSTNNTDCDDTDNTVNTPQQYYVDADGDGFGSTTIAMLCESSAPAGYSTNNTDCDDTDNTVNTPQQYYVDADGDGFGSTTIAMLCESSAPAGYSDNNTDCDDTDNTVNTPQQYYVDADGDGFGSTTTAMLCESSAPAGYSTNNTDCDDTDNTVYPGAPVIYNDGIDQDCDGSDETTLNTEDINLESIIVTPNPFNENITIKLPLNFNNSEFNIKVFDLNGRLVFDKKYLSINNQIHINGLNKLDQAPYLFKIVNTKTGITSYKRLIKY